LLYFYFCFFAVVSHCDTFGQLASQYVPNSFNESVFFLRNLTSNSLPNEVRPLRKALLITRNFLDIFVFSYPIISSKNRTDVWHDIRKDFDSGYTLIGDFQDLAHMGVNYTEDELIKRRDKCLDWKFSFLTNSFDEHYASFLNMSDPNRFFNRSDDELSSFFWGGVPVRPSGKLSGYQNLALLTSALYNVSVDRYIVVITLKHAYEDHPQFHAFRKVTRGILSLMSEFPEIFQSLTLFQDEKFEHRSGDIDNSGQDIVSKYFPIIDSKWKQRNWHCNVTDGGDVLQQVYDTFGDINDILNALEYYEKNGKKKESRKGTSKGR